VAAPVGGLISALAAAPVPHLVGDGLGWLAGGTAWLYLRLMVIAGTAAASVPFASVNVTAPAWLAAAWYPGLALVWLQLRLRLPAASVDAPVPLAPLPEAAPSAARLRGLAWLARRLLRTRVLALTTVIALGAISLVCLPDGRLHLWMLDVGQGDAILVESGDGHTMLIDGGPDPDLALRRLGEVLPFFRRRIDVVLLTHPHQDHVAGLVEVLRRYDVRLVLDSGRDFDNPTYATFVALARAEPGAELTNARAGQRLELGAGASFTVLYPSDADAAGPLPDGDINNASVVGTLRAGSFNALLTGDAEAPVEARLLSRGLLGPIDVLKVGHHGSRSSTTPPFLQAVDPAIALISVGTGNDYGHPAPVTLAALAARPGLVVHRTDTDGTIEVISDGHSFRAATRLGRDPLRSVRAAAGAPQASATTLAARVSIFAWPRWDSTTRAGCSTRSSCRTGSWSILRASSWSPPRRRTWSNRRGYRSTSGWSRSPPCCTTSTSPRRAASRSSTDALRLDG
jgi:competence protein ComEC